MKIIMLTVGTFGALRPMLGLAVGLREAGHNVVIGSHDNFRPMIEEHGIGFSPIAVHSSGIASDNSRNSQFSSGVIQFDT